MTSSTQTFLISQIFVLLSLGLLAWVGYDTWGKYQQGYISSQQVQQKQIPKEKINRPIYRQQEVIAAHLFGRKRNEPIKPQPVEAPKTRLKLKLYGLVGSEDLEYARAIIGVGDKRIARSYAVGDQISDTDATLHKVEPAQVFIDRSGNIESLPLERKPRRRGGGQQNVMAQIPDQNFQDEIESQQLERARILNQNLQNQIQTAPLNSNIENQEVIEQQ